MVDEAAVVEAAAEDEEDVEEEGAELAGKVEARAIAKDAKPQARGHHLPRLRAEGPHQARLPKANAEGREPRHQ